eukprot:5727551-Pyramimonas_sp.AAC.1
MTTGWVVGSMGCSFTSSFRIACLTELKSSRPPANVRMLILFCAVRQAPSSNKRVLTFPGRIN